jgi:ketosteroid isomerase-like protein
MDLETALDLAVVWQRSDHLRLRNSPDDSVTWTDRGGGLVAQEHDPPLEEYRRAGLEITNGNLDVYKSLYSRQDDVTLANPFGPPALGWTEVSARFDAAAANYQDGETVGFENFSTVITPELAYTVEIENYRARVGGSDELTPVSVRVTTVFRREDGAWKVIHRHADPITSNRPAESVVGR